MKIHQLHKVEFDILAVYDSAYGSTSNTIVPFEFIQSLIDRHHNGYTISDLHDLVIPIDAIHRPIRYSFLV
jgi:hypothetical protein